MKVVLYIFILIHLPQITKAENNFVASIEWLTVDADVIVRGSIIQYEEKTTVTGNQVTIKLSVEIFYVDSILQRNRYYCGYNHYQCKDSINSLVHCNRLPGKIWADNPCPKNYPALPVNIIFLPPSSLHQSKQK